MRLFLGISLAATVIDELSAVSARLKSRKDGLRWTASESWHITLQFLGNTGPEAYECLAARLCELRSPPVAIQLEVLGFFNRPGILSACVRLTPELLSLHERVTAATALCGYVPESRPYHPHVTLARGESRGPGLRELKSRIHRQPTFRKFIAKEFLLYESLPGPAGSRYEIRNRFPLGTTVSIGS